MAVARWWSLAAAAPALLSPRPLEALAEVRTALEPYGSKPLLPRDAKPLRGASEALYRAALDALEGYASEPLGGEREGGIAAFMAAAEALEAAGPGASARLSLAMAGLAGASRGAGSLLLWSHVAARAAASGGRASGSRQPGPLEELVELAVEAALEFGPWSLVSPPPAPSVNPAAARLLAMATRRAPQPRPPAPWEAFHLLHSRPRGARKPRYTEPHWRPPPLPAPRPRGRATGLPVCSVCGSAPGLLDGLCPACREALRLGGQGVVAAALQRPPRLPGLPGRCPLGLCPWDPPGAAGRAASMLKAHGLEVAAASGSGALASAGSMGEAFRAAAAAAVSGLTGLAGEPWVLEAATAPGPPAALLRLGPRCASPPCSSRGACDRFCRGLVLVAFKGVLGVVPARPGFEGMSDPLGAVALLAGSLPAPLLAGLGDAASRGGPAALAATPGGAEALEALRRAGVDAGEAAGLGAAVWLRGRPCPRGWSPLPGCPGYCYTSLLAVLLYAAAALAGAYHSRA